MAKWIDRKRLIPLSLDDAPAHHDHYDEKANAEIEIYWSCSVCDYEGSRITRPYLKRCPNCGAKMDVE